MLHVNIIYHPSRCWDSIKILTFLARLFSSLPDVTIVLSIKYELLLCLECKHDVDLVIIVFIWLTYWCSDLQFPWYFLKGMTRCLCLTKVSSCVCVTLSSITDQLIETWDVSDNVINVCKGSFKVSAFSIFLQALGIFSLLMVTTLCAITVL